MTGAVTVCADMSAAGHRALRWAVTETWRRHAALQVVAGPHPKPIADASVFSRIMAMVRAAAPGLPVLARATDGPAASSLRELSAEATSLVLPATLPDLPTVVAESYCPVVVVPAGVVPEVAVPHAVVDAGAQPPDATGWPVVLAVAPWTCEEVFEFAFRAATERHAPVLAVRTWTNPRIDLGSLQPERISRWDAAHRRARQELDIALSAWTVAYPDVTVQTMVAQDDAAEFLISLSHRAELLVIGRSVRGALLGAFAGSPVQALVTRAQCPVMVVPAEGPPRWTWLPSRRRRLTDTRR